MRTGADTAIQRIRVWDLPTRLFHWSLAASFVAAFATAESERWRDIHVMAGYAMAALIAFRLVWGFAGGTYARFSGFMPTPTSVAAYLRSLLSGQPIHYVGHNPAGAIAIFLLLGLGALTAASGWLVLEDIGGGLLEEVHEAAANGMMAMVAVHLAGVIVAGWLHRENLVKAMVTGWKSIRNETPAG